MDKYSIAKNIFDGYISKIEPSSDLAKSAGPNCVCKTPEQIIKQGHGFCSEQIELAEKLFKQKNVYVDKYQLFAVPKNDERFVKIELSHAFIGIPNDINWILFETTFRQRNRGGVKIFQNAEMGIQYIFKLYNQSLMVSNINGLDLTLYKYDFSAINKTFSDFATMVLNKGVRVK